ncbi:unnamed protein product [Ectocarpus sp. 6 AP-2014]
MSTHQDRKSTLHGTGDMILDLVCDLATPRQWTKWLRVPLEHAAGTGNAALVEKLLKVGANASAGWRGCGGRTLMHAGAEGGSEQVISMLTRAGAGKYINDRAPVSGLTPLHLAVSGGKLAATKVLMLAGADVNRLDADGVAPLHLASSTVTRSLLRCFCSAEPMPTSNSAMATFPFTSLPAVGKTGYYVVCCTRGRRWIAAVPQGIPRYVMH